MNPSLTEAPDLVEAVVVVDTVVEAVHPILVDREAGQDGRPARGTAADGGECPGEDSAPSSQSIKMRSLHHGIPQCAYL